MSVENPTSKVELSSEQKETLDCVNKAMETLQRVKILIEKGNTIGDQLKAVEGMLKDMEYMAMDLELSKYEKEL